MGVAPPWASVAHCRPRVAVAATQLSSKQPAVLLCNTQPGKEWAPLRQRLVLGCSLVTAVICAVKHLGAVQLSAAGDKVKQMVEEEELFLLSDKVIRVRGVSACNPVHTTS